MWGNTAVCKGKALRKKDDGTAAKRNKEMSIGVLESRSWFGRQVPSWHYVQCLLMGGYALSVCFFNCLIRGIVCISPVPGCSLVQVQMVTLLMLAGDMVA